MAAALQARVSAGHRVFMGRGVLCAPLHPMDLPARSTFSWPQIQRQEAEQRSLRAGGRGWKVQAAPEVGTGTTQGGGGLGKSQLLDRPQPWQRQRGAPG